MMHPRRWVRARLHRRLFVWFGVAIVATLFAASLSARLVESSWATQFADLRRLGVTLLARTWDDPGERRRLVEAVERELNVEVVLEDAAGEVIDARPETACPHAISFPVERDGVRLGAARVCRLHAHHGGLAFLLALGTGGGALWALSGLVARRIARPLSDLSRVATEIGSGNLRSRIRLGRHAPGEVGELADAVNDMAVRIERQLEDQRELLAGVSHEIRTPLGRLRVLLEIVRDRAATPEHIAAMEREIIEIDDLVAQLLASSRLDFSALERRTLAAADLARAALDRAGLTASLLVDDCRGAAVRVDPTLIARALANLIDNANRHGGGVTSIRLTTQQGTLQFSVEDEGPGFPGDFLARAFESFTRSVESERTGTSLGLGLSLVRRIAEAHGGSAFAENRRGGGACVGIELPIDRHEDETARAV
jgi:two-component system OmpR family sensor kinase